MNYFSIFLLPTMSKRPVAEAPDGIPNPMKKTAKKQDDEADLDLMHLYDTADTSPKSQRFLTEQNITNIATLMSKASKLGQATLPHINKGTQKLLHKFCLWYKDFYSKHSADIDWKLHFDEDSLTHYENPNNSHGLLEGDLERVCDEIDMTTQTRQKLAELGITSIEALLGVKTNLELFSLKDIKKTTQRNLLKFCLWHEDFFRKHDFEVAWLPHFNDDSFAGFEQEPSIERDYRTFLDRLHEGPSDGGIAKVSEKMYEYAASITSRYLSKQIVQQCKNKFSPYDVALKCTRGLMHPTGKPKEIIHLVSGKTQSGKSTVIAVCAAVHRQLSCFLIVITKGIAERDDLKIKLSRLLGGCRETMDAGVLVIADTGAQIHKAAKAIKEIRKEKPHARVGVIVDEADAMYRTTDGSQVMEQRYSELMDLDLSFRMEVSATIYSAIQALDEKGKQVELMEILTTEEYSGINEMKHLQDANDKDVFLDMNHIKAGEGVAYSPCTQELERTHPVLFTEDCELNPNCSGCMKTSGCERHADTVNKRWTVGRRSYIPYTSQPMMDLFGQALQSNKLGTLVLVATNPRVYAGHNVVEQAACIQNYFRNQGKDMAVVVATGRGMYFRLPGFIKGRFIRKRLKTMSEVIEQIDKRVGLEIPMAIFGYSRVVRCVSFRSSVRVPTHMILCRGPGYSLEDYIQALGRAAFNG